MIDAVPSRYAVPFDSGFRIADAPTTPSDDHVGKKDGKKKLKKTVKEMAELQRVFSAQDRYSLLLVFQAMDAAGKDGTIRAVTSGVNPAGFQVSAFKKPSAEELDHDFLWRTAQRLPERGRIGIFNRSYYEEVLVVRVHPEFLEAQRLPHVPPLDELWEQRFESIRSHEAHLAQNGTVILKFWLNVSKAEQRRRFLDRIKQPEKNWKFSARDVKERGHWDTYMHAYEEMLNATSRPWAPWYAIPADNKPYMRLTVARIIVRALQAMQLVYPEPSAEEREKLLDMARLLRNED